MSDEYTTPEADNPSERRGFGPDRRGATRGGKYDRRRNRCARCRFFEARPVDGDGYCHKHEKPMAADAFVCVLFEGLSPLP